jgi:hypothetical protein
MSIHYQNRVIGEVRATHINGQSGVGVAQLRIVLAWNLFPKRDEVFTVFATSIWVSVAAEGDATFAMLGQATPESAWCEESRDGEPFERPVMYRLNLSHAQLLALEEMRHARGLVFALDVRGNNYGPLGVRNFDEQLRFSVNVSDWGRILKEAGFADLLLVGVHLPAKHESYARPVVELVRRAHEQLVLGHYPAAVADCRLAIESLWKSANLTASARDARKRLVNVDGQLSMSKRDRELALGEALRIFCHTAHHVGHDAEPEIFGRTDAALAVSTVAALISSLVADPDLVQVAALPAVAAKASDVGTPAKVTGGEEPAKKSPSKANGSITLAQQVAKVREHFTKNPKNRPSTLKTLRSVLESIFAKKLDSAGLERLEKELIKQKIVTEAAGKLTYGVKA